MANRNIQLLIRLLVILVPTYTVAYITNAMIYTMPMLAACTLLAANLFNDDETEIRVDEDGGDGSDGGDLDG
ncbi:hypothetical protein OAL76_02475 [Gammaproteobacteria bacterium]|nr:hypothetical protein [Gammaproteobacteria bacterium]